MEAADGGEAAREVILKDRRVGAGDAELGDEAGGVAAGAVGPLADEEVLSQLEIAAGEAELAEGLLKRGGDEMALGGAEGNVAGIVREVDFAGKNVAMPSARSSSGTPWTRGLMMLTSSARRDVEIAKSGVRR